MPLLAESSSLTDNGKRARLGRRRNGHGSSTVAKFPSSSHLNPISGAGRTIAVGTVRTHQEIDRRSLAMARAIVDTIDRDPTRAGLARAKATCRRWVEQRPLPAFREWLHILERPWEDVRGLLLDESELGRRLRQSDPFCGILTPQERWEIYRAARETR